MDLFDFNAPVKATIIFDESDDDTFETKPPNHNPPSLMNQPPQTEKEKVTKDSSKIENVQDVIERQVASSFFTPNTNTRKTETCAPAKYDIEITIRDISNDIESITNKIKEHASQQKVLDMPSLEDGCDKNIEMVSNKRSNSKKRNLRDIPPKAKNISKRKFTDKLDGSGKIANTAKVSAENKNVCNKMCIEDFNQNHQKQITKGSDHLNRSDDNNEARQHLHDAAFNRNQEMSHIDNQKQNVATKNSYMINVEINPTSQLVTQEETHSNDSLNVNKTVVTYLKGLLNTLSDHMIYILSAYQPLANLIKTSADQRLIENAKNNYMRTRNHFFDLSYSSLVNIILARNDDPTFVKNFINETVQISHSKSYNYLYKDFEMLYSYMVMWAKKKQAQIQNINISLLANPNQFLLQELQKPCSKSPAYHKNQQAQKEIPALRQQHKQSKVTRAKINEAPNSLELNHYIQYPTTQQWPNSMELNKSLPYAVQNEHYPRRSSAPNATSYHTPRFPEHGNNIASTYSRQQTAYRPHQGDEIQIGAYSNNTLEKMNYNLQQIQNQVSNIHAYHPGNNYEVPSVSLHPDTAPWVKSANPTGQKQASHVRPYGMLPSYAPNHQEVTSSQYNQSIQPENTTLTESNRSSISRDSGFMSPLNFNVLNDVSQQEEHRPMQSTTPLITHVTSLNPNAPLMKEGNCIVCGKVTKQKCIGCFGCYYCSYDCQFRDWKVHQLYCKQ